MIKNKYEHQLNPFEILMKEYDKHKLNKNEKYSKNNNCIINDFIQRNKKEINYKRRLSQINKDNSKNRNEIKNNNKINDNENKDILNFSENKKNNQNEINKTKSYQKIKNIFDCLSRKNLPKKYIDELIGNLFNEQKNAEIKFDINKINKIKYEDPKEISNSSNLVILRSFLNSFYNKIKSFDLINDFDEKNKSKNDNINNNKDNDIDNHIKDFTITFEQFENILVKLGFMKKFDNENRKIPISAYAIEKEKLKEINNKNNDNIEISKKFNIKDSIGIYNINNKSNKNRNKNKLLNEAWDILTYINIEKYGIYRIDFNLIIVFFLIIIGIYRGNDKLNNENFYLKNNKIKRLIKFNLKEKNVSKENLLSFINTSEDRSKNTLSDDIKKEKLQNNDQNIENNIPNKIKQNDFNKVENYEDYNETIDKNLYINKITYDIKSIFPNFDKRYFIFENDTTVIIRTLFLIFYENWANMNFENKRRKKRYYSINYGKLI
jgi:hypothetical protein